MVWYLLVCMASGSNCLPIQYMTSLDECQLVAREYKSLSGRTDVKARCIVLRRLDDASMD